jgi:hypothetical protein
VRLDDGVRVWRIGEAVRRPVVAEEHVEARHAVLVRLPGLDPLRDSLGELGADVTHLVMVDELWHLSPL